MNVPQNVQAGCAEAGQLKDLLALHEAALASMSHGLCMTDARQRLTLFNQRFLELFELSPEVARIGMPMADLIRHSGERGNYPVEQHAEIVRRRAENMARGKPFRLIRQMSRGRTFAMDYRPLPNGGWVTLVDDITERQREQYEHAHPVRALRPGDHAHVARAVRDRRATAASCCSTSSSSRCTTSRPTSSRSASRCAT